MNEDALKSLREEALRTNIPIMQEETLDYIGSLITRHQYHTVLELGTAIGYSSLSLLHRVGQLSITTIERDEQRYLQAMENFNVFRTRDSIICHWMDVYDFETTACFDVLIIDAAKAQNQPFYERFKDNVRSGGCIIIDNMNFHGLDSKQAKKDHRRNLSIMLDRIEKFDAYIESSDLAYNRYDIGDGLLVIWK